MRSESITSPAVQVSAANNRTGYRSFTLGGFQFSRDEYFVHISWSAKDQSMSHTMSADAFLRAMMRDVAWGFFYGWVNFDAVIGTRNLYGKVEMYAGRYHPAYKDKGLDHTETFDSPLIMATFKAILDDWTNEGFDPFAAPDETGKGWLGFKNGSNRAAIERERQACKRMPGLPGDTPLRSDTNGYPVNRAFTDVSQDEPEIHAEPGFEGEVHGSVCSSTCRARMSPGTRRCLQCAVAACAARRPRSTFCQSSTAMTASSGSFSSAMSSTGKSRTRTPVHRVPRCA